MKVRLCNICTDKTVTYVGKFIVLSELLYFDWITNLLELLASEENLGYDSIAHDSII